MCERLNQEKSALKKIGFRLVFGCITLILEIYLVSSLANPRMVEPD
jgi:hypothetical protein